MFGTALLAAVSCCAPGRAWADQKDWKGTVGIPAGAATKIDPWIINVYEPPAKKGGQPIKTELKMTNLPVFDPTKETALDASKRKAKAIADEANAQLGAGRATVGTVTKEVVVRVIPNPNPRFPPQVIKQKVTLATVTITGLESTKAPEQTTNPVREFGDGGQFLPGGGGGGTGSPGYRPSMGSPGGKSMSATGRDWKNDYSFVQFGVDDLVATVAPTSGELIDHVLTDLGQQLTHDGLPNYFDSSHKILTLLSPIHPGQTEQWANTDTGLRFTINTFSSKAEQVIGLKVLQQELRRQLVATVKLAYCQSASPSQARCRA
jgi:hypothetical protein